MHRTLILRGLPAAWLGVFLFLLVTSASAAYPLPDGFTALALAGLLWCTCFDREALRRILTDHRLLLGAATGVVLAMLATAALLAMRHPARLSMPQPPQTGLLLCLAPLATLLADRQRARIAAFTLAALSAWHLVALPLEGVSGIKWSWHVVDLLPRQLGPLNYQASGLAWQAYYFTGLFLGAFYLAVGALGEERLLPGWQLDARSWLMLSLAWAAAVACVQSRSAFAGTLAASLVGLLAFSHVRGRRLWIVAGVVAACGVAVFWLLFSENKSGPGLRLAYLKLYLVRSFDPEWLWTGRGYTIFPDLSMQVPGLQYLHHSHNDIAQVFFAWGLPVAAAYVVFWFALLRLALRFWRAGHYWPVLSLIAVGPSLVTDLGWHHLEKAAFIAMLAAMCMTFAPPFRLPRQPARR